MNKIISENNLKNLFDILLVITGTFLMGFSFNVFLNANHISPSGFSGLCAIISNVLDSNFGVIIHPSILYLSINAVLFIFAFKRMGVKFAINAAIGIATYSLFIEICQFDIGLSGNENLLLYATFGGVLTGVGLGLVFRGHGSTGGSDMLANILGKRFRFITVGNLVFIVDAIVVALSFFAYNNINNSLYSLIAIWIMTKMSDVVVSGVQGVRGYYIVSSKYKEISTAIMQELDRGVTGYDARGMYTGTETEVLMTLVTREESVKLRQIVAQIDKNAFMFSCPISEAMGHGFTPLDVNKSMIKKNNYSKNKKTKMK